MRRIDGSPLRAQSQRFFCPRRRAILDQYQRAARDRGGRDGLRARAAARPRGATEAGFLSGVDEGEPRAGGVAQASQTSDCTNVGIEAIDSATSILSELLLITAERKLYGVGPLSDLK